MKRQVAKMTVLLAVMVMAVPASADDARIAKQIIAKLNQQKQAANLKGFDLGVQVDKGTVTMMGQVASSEQAMLALDLARRIPGVKLVVNDLYVDQVKPQRSEAPTIARQPPHRQMAAPTAQPVSYQQQALPQPIAQPVPHYNATGAVGSAISHPQAQRPVAFARSTIRQASAQGPVAPANYVGGGSYGGEMVVGGGYGGGMVSDNPSVPGYAWPSYAASPNYGAVSYPQQYSATAWPYIGPFYPYPQVPLGWRKVSLEWDDGWWFLDFTKK